MVNCKSTIPKSRFFFCFYLQKILLQELFHYFSIKSTKIIQYYNSSVIFIFVFRSFFIKSWNMSYFPVNWDFLHNLTSVKKICLHNAYKFSVPASSNCAGTPQTTHDVLLFKDLRVILTISVSKLILSISVLFVSYNLVCWSPKLRSPFSVKSPLKYI